MMEISSKVGPWGGEGHLNVSTRPLTAHRGNANGSVTGIRMRIAARAGGDRDVPMEWSYCLRHSFLHKSSGSERAAKHGS
jgi:hypothetical protein